MFDSKKIAIYGFGKEGKSAMKFLKGNNQITVIDDGLKGDFDQSEISNLENQGIRFIFHSKKVVGPFDVLVRSPGVQPENKMIQSLKSQGTLITSTTNIFFDVCPAITIGVTGTKGKGTTSTLIYEMLKTGGFDVHLAGNIGTPALDIIPNLKKNSYVVLELSSFQLIDLKKSPHIAVVLMVTSEHLNWHKNNKEYLEAKSHLVSNQNKEDFTVVNWDYENSQKIAQKTQAQLVKVSTHHQAEVFLKGSKIISKIAKDDDVISVSNVKLPGKHNLENICAAVAVSKLLKAKNEDIEKVINSFAGLPNRLELIAKQNGVSYYNDSFSTTPETTTAAINAFSAPKILIVGGSSKNSDFQTLVKTISEDKSVKCVVLIGEEAAKIRILLEGLKTHPPLINGEKTMEGIVKQARKVAENGDIVLLSPACASFDMFENYIDRGQQFRQAVLKTGI